MYPQAPARTDATALSLNLFKKTETYWWRGKATRRGAAAGASGDRARVHGHRDRAGWRKRHRWRETSLRRAANGARLTENLSKLPHFRVEPQIHTHRLITAPMDKTKNAAITKPVSTQIWEKQL